MRYCIGIPMLLQFVPQIFDSSITRVFSNILLMSVLRDSSSKFPSFVIIKVSFSHMVVVLAALSTLGRCYIHGLKLWSYKLTRVEVRVDTAGLGKSIVIFLRSDSARFLDNVNVLFIFLLVFLFQLPNVALCKGIIVDLVFWNLLICSAFVPFSYHLNNLMGIRKYFLLGSFTFGVGDRIARYLLDRQFLRRVLKNVFVFLRKHLQWI